MKHIYVDLHFLLDLVGKGFLSVSRVNTLDQLAVMMCYRWNVGFARAN